VSKGIFDRVLAFIGVEVIEEEEEEGSEQAEPRSRPRRRRRPAETYGAGPEVLLGGGEDRSGGRRGAWLRETTSRDVSSPRVVSFPTPRGAPGAGRSLQVLVVTPTGFEEVQSIAENLKAWRPVIVNLERCDREVARRVVDFLSGTVFALDGTTERVGHQIFFFAPANVEVSLDQRAGWADHHFG